MSPDDRRVPFGDLKNDILNLLRRIDDGRIDLESAKAIFEKFDAAQQRLESANGKWTEFNSRHRPQDEELRRKHEKERKRLNKNYTALQTELSKSYVARKEARRFIDEFASDLDLFAQRLPLTDNWQRYKNVILSLIPGILKSGSWKKRGDDGFDPALETLGRRLHEMLDLPIDHPTLEISTADAGQDQAISRKKGKLSPRDTEIEGVLIKKFGPRWAEYHDNPEIIDKALREVRAKVEKPTLGRPALRASLNRIRTAGGHRSSASVGKQIRSKD